ncbi:MAG: hypothetical protein KGL45_06755 [Gammaproteobacteria bacterium]|nr:hypothetical protein [Gammaproteobacteria bacterium]
MTTPPLDIGAVAYCAHSMGARTRSESVTGADPVTLIASAREAIEAANSGWLPAMERGDAKAVAAAYSNGFVCLVERSWGATTGDPDFWNPKVRGPLCLNPPAVRTVLPIYLMKTKLVLAGKPKEEIVRALAAAFAGNELPPLEPGAMSYMLAKRQYLGDEPKRWHPHLMFFVAGDAARSWGADLPGSPVMAANDPEERMTIFFVWVGNWSDGTPAPGARHPPGAAG